jgi:hypothetical protein
MRGEEAAIMVVMVTALLTIGWVVYVIVDGFRRRQQLRVYTEFHGKLIDRLGSAREFAEFFTSDAGDRFLNSLSRTEGGAPSVRILRSLQSGLVLLALGLGLFLLVTVRSFSIEAVDAFAVFATAATAIGSALLISSALSFVLSRRLGLLQAAQPERDRETTRSV